MGTSTQLLPLLLHPEIAVRRQALLALANVRTSKKKKLRSLCGVKPSSLSLMYGLVKNKKNEIAVRRCSLSLCSMQQLRLELPQEL